MNEYSTDGLFEKLLDRIFQENAKYYNINVCIDELSNDIIFALDTIKTILDHPSYPTNIDGTCFFCEGRLRLHHLFVWAYLDDRMYLGATADVAFVNIANFFTQIIISKISLERGEKINMAVKYLYYDIRGEVIKIISEVLANCFSESTQKLFWL